MASASNIDHLRIQSQVTTTNGIILSTNMRKLRCERSLKSLTEQVCAKWEGEHGFDGDAENIVSIEYRTEKGSIRICDDDDVEDLNDEVLNIVFLDPTLTAEVETAKKRKRSKSRMSYLSVLEYLHNFI